MPRVLVAVCVLLATGCSSHKLAAADARRLIENSPRFTDPDVLRVKPRYCSAALSAGDALASAAGRLRLLADAGAIHVEVRPAAAGECTSLPGTSRQWAVLSLTEIGTNFHPRPLDDGGWEFVLAHRRFISLGEITFNSDDDPTIAHTVYRWAWRAELIGQLLQVSEDPVNAQASFTRPGSEWRLRDVGL